MLATDRKQVLDICTSEILVPFEGTGPMSEDKQFFLAYKDPGPTGLPITIAWGITFDETGKPIKLGDKWSVERALSHKATVLSDFLDKLLRSSPGLSKQPSRRVAAVLSWVYNLGIGNYNKSWFKKVIDAEDWMQAAEECKKWNKAGGKVLNGLTKRRSTEAAFILMA